MVKKSLSIALALIILISGFPIEAATTTAEVVFHVSPNGNDRNQGTADKPFASLEGAKLAVRAVKGRADGPNTPVKVIFHEGKYVMNKGVVFDGNDSGTAKGPISYEAAPGEKVEFVGSVQLDLTKFQGVTDDKVLARIPVEARGKVGQLDLKAQGVPTITPWETKVGYSMSQTRSYVNLYLNEVEQLLSRWPNFEWAPIGKVVTQGAAKVRGDNSGRPSVFKFNNDRFERWATAKNALAEGFFFVDYAHEVVTLKADKAERTISVGSNLYGIEEGKRFAVRNLLEELDIPGEWYIEVDSQILYYYPSYPSKDAKLTMSILTEDFITLDTTEYISFKDLDFKETRGGAVNIKGSKNIEVVGSTIKNTGSFGVNIRKSTNCTVRDCDFLNILSYAVYIEGGDRQTLSPGNNLFVNNHIWKTNGFIRSGSATMLSGVGNTIRNNVMQNSPFASIVQGENPEGAGNDNNILYNELYNDSREVRDMGTIYVGRNVVMRGHEWAYNYIHDSGIAQEILSKLPTNAIYLDDGHCGVNAHHNIIRNVDSGFMLGGGHDNKFENNIIIDAKTAMILQARYVRWPGTMFKPGGTLYEQPKTVPYTEPPYSTKYPELVNFYKRVPLDNPWNNTIRNNLMINSGKPANDAMVAECGIVENNIEMKKDPGFTNPEEQNYRIKDDAEILKQLPDINKYKMEDIGLIANERRDLSKKPSSPFRMMGPANGAKNVDGTRCEFFWEEAPYADKYRLIIATDPEMKKVVYDGETYFNYKKIGNLDSGNKTYYWKVEAINTSRQLANRWFCVGGPYSFETTQYDVLDKNQLKTGVENAEGLLKTLSEGDQPGQFKKGTKAEFTKALDNAKQALAVKIGRQADLDNAYKDLLVANAELTKKAILRPVDMGSIMKEKADWETVNVNYESGPNGEVNVTSETGGDFGYKKIIKNGDVLTFKMKADYTGWVGLGARVNKIASKPYSEGNKGYLIVIKKDVIEFQQHNHGQHILKSIPNNYITDNEWHEIQYGAVNFGGMDMVILKIDGKTVFFETDDMHIIKEDGYFTMPIPKGGKFSFTKPDKLPTDIMADVTPTTDQAVSIDNEGKMFNTTYKGYTEKGEWKKIDTAGYKGAEVKVAAGAKVSASWNIELPPADYRVYYWCNPDPAGDKDAIINVVTPDENEKIKIDFSKGVAGWKDLGVYSVSSPFTAMGNLGVELKGSGNGQLMASVIRCVKVDSTAHNISKFFRGQGETLALKIDSKKALKSGTNVEVPDVLPQVINDRTLVPVRFVSEVMGGNVAWNGETNTATITVGANTVTFTVDSTEYTINGDKKILDQGATVINGRMMIPLRAMAEAIGKNVYWDQSGLIIIADSVDYNDPSSKELLPKISNALN